MFAIRPIRTSDIESLYAISLATGHKGEDASHLYDDPRMMGHIYSAPYANLSPKTCFIAVQDNEVAGYIVGTHDTKTFEQNLEKNWWPGLREEYPCPNVASKLNWTADQKRAALIHHPERTPTQIIDRYPAHLHMNLHSNAQGQGLGPALLKKWIDHARSCGVDGVFIGANIHNTRAINFWQKQGFQNINHLLKPKTVRASYFGIKIQSASQVTL